MMTPPSTMAPLHAASGSDLAAIRLGLILDYAEENWPSMDLVGAMIQEHLRNGHAAEVAATVIRPPFHTRLGRLPGLGRRRAAFNADRLWNRFWDYPRVLRRLIAQTNFDLFHLVDHSYAQLVHELPADRTVVTCHDLDTFRCLLEPDREPRPRWFRAMARRTLDGLRKAVAVACNSETTRRQILAHALLPPERLHVVPMAVDPTCRPEPDAASDAEAAQRLGPISAPELLHVGTTIPRKRIDILLKIFASIRRALPEARLIKVGGAFTPEQAALAEELGIAGAITHLGFLDRSTLAAVYRRAALVLQPSEAEGFGLPVAEALACGAVVLASDIEALREVGGEATAYAPVADIDAWTHAALALLDARQRDDDLWKRRRADGLARAEAFRWTTHADQLVRIYQSVLGR